jgi:hypothetical protein
MCFVLTVPACSESDPQSPANSTNGTSSISGTVVYDPTGGPAAGVDVILERQTGNMMTMGYRWDQTAHTMSDSHGQFRFDYTFDGMHHYRVGVRGMDDWHMCDWDRRYEDGVVLHVPTQGR